MSSFWVPSIFWKSNMKAIIFKTLYSMLGFGKYDQHWFYTEYSIYTPVSVL